jgi:hypothetical protein
MAFLHTMTAYVCGIRRALTIRADGGAGYPLLFNGRNNLHCLKLPVSVSPTLKIQDQKIQVCEARKFAWNWVEDVIADISALRSMASSITSTTLHRATADWRSAVRRIRVSEIECPGLASPTSVAISLIAWLLAWQAFVTARLCSVAQALSSRKQESLYVAVLNSPNTIVAVTTSLFVEKRIIAMHQIFR